MNSHLVFRAVQLHSIDGRRPSKFGQQSLNIQVLVSQGSVQYKMSQIENIFLSELHSNSEMNLFSTRTHSIALNKEKT